MARTPRTPRTALLLLLASLALAGAAALPTHTTRASSASVPDVDATAVPQVQNITEKLLIDGAEDDDGLDEDGIFVDEDDATLHPAGPFRGLDLSREDSLDSPTVSPDHIAEITSEFWRFSARKRVDYLANREEIYTSANNLILFLGDGMSVPTLAATRVYMGGEEQELSFEKFPYVGLSKTYCVNTQVADSACSATAYLCGVKGNLGTMGLNANVTRKNCKGQNFEGNRVDSILAWAQRAGMSTGVVTTTRVTHASPGATYAHIADREWEADDAVKKDNFDPAQCKDIAQQLITESPGKDIDVIMGGGRGNFLPKMNKKTRRLDGRNLIEEWKVNKREQKRRAAYVENRKGLLKIDPKTTDSLLGLFDFSHMQYSLDSSDNQPSLAEMTEAAIKILDKNPKGYFLFVEGGRIDHGHHNARPHYALDETKQFSEAVQKAVDLTDELETLIVVTSDHSHTMSLAGYAQRGQDIFKFAGQSGIDGLPYTTLTYANGPGYRAPTAGQRPILSEEELKDVKTAFPSTVPLSSETHGGDDVAIFARGPFAHLYSGVHEQHVIPHIMAYAASIGDYTDHGERGKDAATTAPVSAGLVALALAAALLLALRP